MANKEVINYPFHILPPPQTHKKIGTILVMLSYIIILVFFYLLIFIDPRPWGIPYEKSLRLGYYILIFLLLVGNVISKYGYALRQQSAIDLINSDPRKPILYLRSFNDDSVPDYTKSFIPLGPNKTVEMRLADVFKKIGPVISIGIPGESIPKLGANRLYVTDHDWKQAIQYFLEKASVVIILVGKSTGIKWEISTALHNVPLDKILLVFPYIISEPRGRKNKWIQLIKMKIYNFELPEGKSDQLGERLLNQLQEDRNARYATFCADFGRLFEKALPQNLSSSIFIDFSREGYARLIPTRKPLLFRRDRDNQGITFDYERTLRPFIEKIQNHIIQPTYYERLLTKRINFLILFFISVLAAIGCFSYLIIFLDSQIIILSIVGLFFIYLAFVGYNNFIDSSLFDNHELGLSSNRKEMISTGRFPLSQQTLTHPSLIKVILAHFSYILLSIIILISIVDDAISGILSTILHKPYAFTLYWAIAFLDFHLAFIFYIMIFIMRDITRNKLSGTYLRSHFRLQYNIFSLWVAFFLIYPVIFLVPSEKIIFSIIFILLNSISLLWSLWLIYRIKRGYRALSAHEAIRW